MPYILLVFGVLIGGYALYRFLMRANKKQAQAVLMSLAVGLIVLMVFVLILSGKLPLAAVLAIILIPLMAKLYKILNTKQD